jgi:uncharacterized RDD family membrane protein YckC
VPVSFPHGWYDDPKDLSGQRYWDGTAWTEHRRPRQRPAPYQGEFGKPHEQSNQAQQQSGQTHQQSSQAQQPGQPQQRASQYGQAPYEGQQNYGGAQYRQQFGPQGFGYGPQLPATPDGVPLSGWWPRVGARILDWIIVAVVSLPATGYYWFHYIQAITRYERDLADRTPVGSMPKIDLTLPTDVTKWIVPLSLIMLAVSYAYEIFFLSRTGATPGKKILGISVRQRDAAGPLKALAVVKRYGLYVGLSLLSAVPIVGVVCTLVILLDVLWPLWDDKKQALHDKVARTNVVLGEQPKRR